MSTKLLSMGGEVTIHAFKWNLMKIKFVNE